MDPGYETVVPFMDLFWTMLVYALHGAVAFVHAALVTYLLATGVGALRENETRAHGVTRVGLGVLLLTPLLAGASAWASIAAGLAALVLLALAGRGALERPVARWLRRGAIAAAAVASAFMLWEREDNLTLGADLVLHAMEWRGTELDWQLSQDPQSPKLGDLAPDFALHDPEGKVQVRLSDFRGTRPVALVFGSYT